MIKLKPEQYFPALLIVIDILAALVYLKQRDTRKVIYWISVAVLNAAVTF